MIIATITRDCSRRTNFGRKLKGKDYQKFLGKIKGRDPELLNFFGTKIKGPDNQNFLGKIKGQNYQIFSKKQGAHCGQN